MGNFKHKARAAFRRVALAAGIVSAVAGAYLLVEFARVLL